ncbi:MAG: hypothetical protein ACO29A_06710 [Ilumatobacteraceae bacterium]
MTTSTRGDLPRLRDGLTTFMATLFLASCFTGPRPTLETVDTLAPVNDPAAESVLRVLTSTPATSFTVGYEIVTKFGGAVTSATVSFDPILGTSVDIADTRYLYTAEGTTTTCSKSTFECTTGIDETRVSDRQLTSTFHKQSAIERIRQDVRVAVGPSVGRTDSLVDMATTCAEFPVVDSAGAPRTKSYCAFDDVSVIASMETADLSVTAISMSPSADPALFQPPA